jgi:hypothetical protein
MQRVKKAVQLRVLGDSDAVEIIKNELVDLYPYAAFSRPMINERDPGVRIYVTVNVEVGQG